jgi:hypothetical protein
MSRLHCTDPDRPRSQWGHRGEGAVRRPRRRRPNDARARRERRSVPPNAADPRPWGRGMLRSGRRPTRPSDPRPQPRRKPLRRCGYPTPPSPTRRLRPRRLARRSPPRSAPPPRLPPPPPPPPPLLPCRRQRPAHPTQHPCPQSRSQRTPAPPPRAVRAPPSPLASVVDVPDFRPTQTPHQSSDAVWIRHCRAAACAQPGGQTRRSRSHSPSQIAARRLTLVGGCAVPHARAVQAQPTAAAAPHVATQRVKQRTLHLYRYQNYSILVHAPRNALKASPPDTQKCLVCSTYA